MKKDDLKAALAEMAEEKPAEEAEEKKSGCGCEHCSCDCEDCK